MRAAVNAGADAVYMGGSRFGARAFAENPEQDALLQACRDEVGTHNLHIGEGRNLIVVGTEAEDKMSLAHGVVATLLRGNLETTGHKEEDIVLVATLKDKFLTRLKGLIYKACFGLNGIGMTSCWTLIRHLGSGFWVSIFG